jgi:hypothetical protein
VSKSTIGRAALLSILGLSFVSAVTAQNNAQTAPPTAPAASTWKINCPGIRNVPMTADAEQSLPLQIIATLKCGEEVVVLANDEGYTAWIKTADGKTGYVAAMYLRKVPAPKRPATIEAATMKDGVARWQPSAPGCEDFISHGILVESLTADGVTVQVSLHDTGWKLRANVAIANAGSQPIHVEPSQFILDDVGVHGKPLFYQDPAVLAKNVTHQVLWTEAIATPSGRLSGPPTELLTASKVSYQPGVATAPNYILGHQNAEEIAVREQGKQTLNKTARQILALALKPTTIQAQDKISGAVWFERDKNPQQLILRIPIGDRTFEFPLSFPQSK